MRLYISVYKHASTRIGLLMLISIIITLASCGGGDDDDFAVDVDPIVPNLLNYEISQPIDLTLTVNQGGMQATISPTRLMGTYNRTTEAFTLDSRGPVMEVSASDFLAALDTEIGNLIGDVVNFSNYNLQVVTAAAWVGDGNPTSGQFDIFDGNVNAPFRKITVTVNPDVGSGIAGVDIVFWPDGEGFPGTSQSVSATWDEFDALFDDGTDAYARIASFAYSVLRFMYEQGDLVISTLEALDDFDALLQQQGSVTEPCDSYPLAPVPAVLDPGMSVFTWNDDFADGELAPGDSFRWDLTQCWDDDVSDDFDLLFDGVLKMEKYAESVDANNMLSFVGFQFFDGSGGVAYDNLVITETETTLTNVVLDTTDAMTLNGGFAMVFFTTP